MINIAILQGNVGKFDTKTLDNGTHVTNLSLCTNKIYIKNGEKQDVPTWHNIVFYNKLSDVVARFVKSGDLIFIQGEFQCQKFTGKDGLEKYKHYIIANELKLIPKANASYKKKEEFVDDAVLF